MKTIEQRFWEKVDKKSENECWLWTGANDYERGVIKIGHKAEKAPRISWTIHFGKIPDGFFVCHKCDIPLCVNPKHLWLGNNSQNMIDCANKNRSNKPKGSKNKSSRLIEDQIIEIRKMYSSGEYSQRDLAKIFSIDQTVIGDIVRKEAWKHI